jgi:hypothetical protein
LCHQTAAVWKDCHCQYDCRLFSKANDTTELFSHCAIAEEEDYGHYQNQYPVIHISFHELPKRCDSYEDYISRIEERLTRNLRQEYPMMEIEEDEAVWDILTDIYGRDERAKFVFVLDEWDFLFHQDFAGEQDKKAYLMFLRNLLKDRPYVRLAYITGILPIAKYSSGSELNMFVEYTMITEERFSDTFGFTEKEVDMLYKRYRRNTEHARVSREGVKQWYNGYHTFSGELHTILVPLSVRCGIIIWEIIGHRQGLMMKFIIIFRRIRLRSEMIVVRIVGAKPQSQ